MPTYAILGATGSTGSSLLEYLHERSDVHLNLYARSAPKLHSLHPYLKGSERAKIYSGELSNVNLLADCLRDVDVVFSTVAQNTNEPGCSIAQRCAHSLVSALELLRKEKGPRDFKCPTVVFLSSASLNDRFFGPSLIHSFLMHALCYIYTDLAKATAYLQDHDWIPLILAQPPGLVQDLPRGHKLSDDKCSNLISYPDLARAMVQMAEEEDGKKWIGKGVSMEALGGKDIKANVMPLVGNVLSGSLAWLFPRLWIFLRDKGWL
ncbi:hypothetical protein MMC24_004858 [Lignoscripta atroalba]|nr:hypothetical protein [Lignoscripta atroalba]